MSMPERGTRAPALILYYATVYGSLGVTLPFFPQYLKSLGLTGTQVGVLLAVGPALAVVAPPWWGQLADRTGRPGVLLTVATAASCALFSLYGWLKGFGAALCVSILQASFGSALSTLIDSMALRHAEQRGGSYAGLRLWGSLGFAIVALTFGRWADAVDQRVIWVSVAMTATGALWAGLTLWPVRVAQSSGPAPSLRAAVELARHPDVRWFLVAGALHWVACGPYHSALSIHATQLGLPMSVVGTTATVAVLSEVLVMALWPRLSARITPVGALTASFVMSGIRWAGMALSADGRVLVVLAVLHGLTFGVFFLASVAYMAERAPDSLRATGQALFVACAFGLGGVVGYLGTGVGMDALPNSSAVFGVAAGLEILPILLVIRLARGAGKGLTESVGTR